MKKFISRELRSSARLALLSTLTAIFLMACGAEEVPIGSVSQTIVGEAHPWTHSDWSSRVAYEARYALSQSANGYSSRQTTNDIYGNPRWYGDWNYVANDSFAHSRASAEAGGGGWVGPTGESGGYYLGGQCTYFVRLVLYRATYWAFNDHYTTPNYTEGSMYNENLYPNEFDANPNNWQPGWALRGNGHYAIADQRAYQGAWGWWVIDSNYVGGGGNYRIGKHFISDSGLSSGGYYGWKPVRASYNW